jgi:peptide/nickel transport system substrate-binding protein
LADALGAVEEIVAMTDRVIEIRLSAPRPNLLQLLAQPEFAILREGRGTGPFKLRKERGADGELQLVREVPRLDGEETREEEVALTAVEARTGIEAFRAQKIDLLLGGTFADLPLAREASLPRNALQFDPVAGLFGLVPARNDGPVAEVEVRRLLSQAIDRGALIAALNVPDLLPRANILQGGLEGFAVVPSPEWFALPIADRRPALIAESDRLFGQEERPQLRIALPEGPGTDLLFQQLQRDWQLLGLELVRVKVGAAADLRLVDAVAPSTSPAWFLRQFRCAVRPVCIEEADTLLEGARATLVASERAALLAQAGQMMDEAQLFIPLAAPVRWSLVSNRVRGFAGNRFARHTLTSLRIPLGRNASE